jgi:hypothetical protein
MRIGLPADHQPPQSLHHGGPGELCLHLEQVRRLPIPALTRSAKRSVRHAAQAHPGEMADPISP